MNTPMRMTRGTAIGAVAAFAVTAFLPIGVLGQDVAPNVYFGGDRLSTGTADVADELDRYEKGRCVDDETVVYFSNGVATGWSEAFRARRRLNDNLKSYLSANGLTNTFGQFRTANAFTQTFGFRLPAIFPFFNDTLLRVFPDSVRLDFAQYHRLRSGRTTLPIAVRREAAAEAIKREATLLQKSPSAGLHAQGYDALLNKGRGQIVVGHSYGTILANASYFGIKSYHRPGHAIVQTALMDTEISGADRFSYRLPFTTIEEDRIASLFPTNKGWNVDLYEGDAAQNSTGHNFIEHYMDAKAGTPGDPARSANTRIMQDVVAMQMMIKPRPCHGHIFGGAGLNVDDITNEYSATQVSFDGTGRYVAHPSLLPGTPESSPDGPTKLVDWRGQFDGGTEATRVLTFSGPAARYNGPAAYGNKVFRWGEIAYSAPGTVLGAAIQRNAKGEEWIVVATHDRIPERESSEIGDTLTVWRRRAELLDRDAAVFDAMDKPDGWRMVLEQPFQPALHVGPWFFNGDGTKAGTMRARTASRNFRSARQKDPGCFSFSATNQPIQCKTGGEWAAVGAGTQDVKKLSRFTLTVPLPNSGGKAGVVENTHESGSAAVLAVDYDDGQELLLREENVGRARGLLDDPDLASVDDFRWLTLNGTPLTDAATLRCAVGGAPCRSQKSGGFPSSIGGFVGLYGDLAKEPVDRLRYHVFYLDLRTRTYAFSRREGDTTEYWLSHEGDTTSLGTEQGLRPRKVNSYVGSRYGYQGDWRNTATDFGWQRMVIRNNVREELGKWDKINPILGQYEIGVRSFDISPPPLFFGVDVAVDGSVVASGYLPNGASFNHHSEVDLEVLLNRSLAGQTVLPMAVR